MVGTRIQQAPAKKPSPFDSLGAPGVAIFGGYLVEQEKDHTLSGREKYTTYSNMLANTAIVAAGVRFFLNIVAKVGWKVEPADDSAEAQEIAEKVEAAMHGMRTPWSRVVRRAAMYRFYGFSLQEWTAKRNEDGTISMLDVEPRAQITIEQWDVDEHGEVLGVVQRSPQDGRDIYLPRQKLLYMVDDSLHDSPEGLGLFRHLAKRAKTLEAYELLEGRGFETDLRGIPVGRAPLTQLEILVAKGDITEEQATALRAPIEDFIKKHIKSPALGLMLDSLTYKAKGDTEQPSQVRQFDVELLKGEGGPHAEIAAAIERLNREQARILGVEHLLLGSDSKGSHALSTDKTQSFGLIVDSTTREIGETYEKDFIRPLGLLNGWPEELWPTLKTDQAQYRDIEQITGALRDMAQAGATIMPNDPVVNEVRDLLGLSHAPELDMTDPDLQLGGTNEEEVPEEEVPEDEDEGEE